MKELQEYCKANNIELEIINSTCVRVVKPGEAPKILRGSGVSQQRFIEDVFTFLKQ